MVRLMSGELIRAVVRVGDGRGFVVEDKLKKRMIITAAHCLPHLPEAASFLSGCERTYTGLIGPLVADDSPVSAECVFVDPVADIAVLGPPDNQELRDEEDAYQNLVAECDVLDVTDVQEASARMLSLAGDWFDCRVEAVMDGVAYWITGAVKPIEGGMSGSPILLPNGAAVGVVCMAGEDAGSDSLHGPNPRLASHLPGWLLGQLGLHLFLPQSVG